MNRPLHFHQTFPPTLDYIRRVLLLGDSSDFMTKEEMSAITGIPTGKSSGKVEPHICYAQYMGLINDEIISGKHFIHRTTLGNEIIRQDPGFQEYITQLICHVRLTSPSTGATMWSVILRDILPQYRNGIETNILNDEIAKRNLGKMNMGPFFSTYKNGLNLLKIVEKDKKRAHLMSLSYIPDCIFVYAYALLYEWEHIFPRTLEITADEIPQLQFGNTFGWDMQKQYEALEHLCEKGIIRMNRQLSPYTIIKQRCSDEMIPLLYSLLC